MRLCIPSQLLSHPLQLKTKPQQTITKTKNVQTKRFASLPNFFSSLGIKDNFNHDNTMMDISKNHEKTNPQMTMAVLCIVRSGKSSLRWYRTSMQCMHPTHYFPLCIFTQIHNKQTDKKAKT